MPDGGALELFPDADLGEAHAATGGCARPIGSRRATRPSPARRRAPSRLLEALRRVERALEAHNVIVLDLSTVAEKLATELATATRERRHTSEAIARLERQFVEMRRSRGETEMHLMPKHTRRRPLG
jgi:hypothetical protein